MRPLGLLVALLVFVLRAEPVDACAAFGPAGPVTIAGEEALIVFDAARGRQHFVRTAAFDGAPSDFGFLVPSPSQPELAEAPAEVFRELFAIYRRPESRRSRGALRAAGGGSEGEVEVVARELVAGLDATVLRATDADALRAWLQRNGYPSSEPLRAWLTPYVTKGWYVTAFKLAPGSRRGFATRAVRMSFDTRLPFYPYAEPAVEGRRGRPFRVSVVAPWRVDARLGHRRWSTAVAFADRPGDRLVSALRDAVPSEAFDASSWLTVFDEPRSIRPDRDLFFARSDESSTVASTIRRRLDVRTVSASDEGSGIGTLPDVRL
ncbi:MAG: DUF2330 domain-containing protein [Myxococcota bacterium]|jgi:hypothetical protein|nr:DUF2330 domain-containing protein [Myxococcota bacterium]